MTGIIAMARPFAMLVIMVLFEVINVTKYSIDQ
jgi:hypothetical protein